MKFNHLIKATVVLLFVSAFSPAVASSGTGAPETVRAARAVQLQNRLNEIKMLDKTTLSKAEKKSLRHEVREVKKELATLNGGVYLSVGAVILIALLLILLL